MLLALKSWENIKENIKTSAKESQGLHELKQQNPWFDEERLGFLDQRRQSKMQWLQDPSQSNENKLNNVRREANRHFRKQRRNI
jgi:dsDNA-specific endonuclease/ATPase MutS2